MSVAAALQDRALIRYLRWVQGSSKVSVHGTVGESSIVGLWREWIFCVLAAARDIPNVAVYLLEEPGSERLVRWIEQLGFTAIVAHRDNALGAGEVRRWLAAAGPRLLAITLDGPAGPRRVAKPGVVRLARVAGAPLRPLHVSAAKAFELKHWDHCLMPAGHGEITLQLLPPIATTGSAVRAAESVGCSLNEAAAAFPSRSVYGVRPLIGYFWARASTMPLQFGAATLAPRGR